ncbi:hypothetical protein GQX74_015324 [Glossina fuscipes]|nr:hypothetical protein GQX74_015324 [Glossina fuscipes]
MPMASVRCVSRILIALNSDTDRNRKGQNPEITVDARKCPPLDNVVNLNVAILDCQSIPCIMIASYTTVFLIQNSLIISEPFSAIIMTGALVLALTKLGIMLASITRKPFIPYTLSSGSTTASESQ